MTRRTLARLITVIVIAIVLGGASLIVSNNSGPVMSDAPSGFLH